MGQATGVIRTGGRTARTRDAVHVATRELMAESADGTVEMAAVAARSGVHIATLYRRWRTPEGLIVDAVVADLGTRSAVPATGDLRADLTVWVTRLLGDLAEPSHVVFIRALIAIANDAVTGPGAAASFTEPRASEIQATLDAADVTVVTWWDVFDLVLAPAYVRALLAVPMHPATDVTRLVDNVIAVVERRTATSMSGQQPSQGLQPGGTGPG